MAQRKTAPKLVTARQARLQFVDDDFVQSIIIINQAILDAAPGSFETVVDIPTGGRTNGMCTAFWVAQRLRENGFNVIMIHDSDNGSSELTINWGSIVPNNDRGDDYHKVEIHHPLEI